MIKAARELRHAGSVKGGRRLRKLLDALKLFGLDLENLPEPGPVPDGGWGQLAQVITSDQPLPEAADPQRFHEYLWQAGAAPARELWELLDAEGPLLDLGGGSGAYSAAFPGESTIADRPSILKLAKSGTKHVGLDLLSIDKYPAGYRTVLLANVLHLLGEKDCSAIVRKAAAALDQGGLLVVKDLDSATPQGILFALNMALFTRDGDVHPAEKVRIWMLEAGLDEPKRRYLMTSPESLVLAARKP